MFYGKSGKRFKVRSAVLAKRADKIFGQGVTLVDIATDLADKALFLLSLGLGLGLDVLEVVAVGDGRLRASVTSATKRVCGP